ncbi:MAG TPA: hypothetical protein VIS96_00475 [Terrimicrobiaceae bacterium]
MDCSKAELIEVICGHVLPRKSTIYYDGLVMEGYKHHRIHLHDNELNELATSELISSALIAVPSPKSRAPAITISGILPKKPKGRCGFC